MDAKWILFIGILLLTEQGAPYQVRVSAVGDHIVGLSGIWLQPHGTHTGTNGRETWEEVG